MNTSGLSRHGRGRTSRPRVYVGCLPCVQGHWAADVEHANNWLENHWRRCRAPFAHRDANAAVSPSKARKVAA
jgi:hypothetical protein